MNAILSLLLLAGPSLDPQSELPSTGAFDQSFGLSAVGGVPTAAGPGFVARFGPEGPTISPLLGRSAPETRAIELQLESIERGGTRILGGLEPMAARIDGAVALYEHPFGIVERYEVSAHGIEQSFVFPSKPGGSGDLVVRMRLEANFPSVHRDGEGHVFAELDGRGLRAGGVVGIDADGARTDGNLAIDSDSWTLTLPGHAVDAASYPLVLDPLIAPIFIPDDAFGDEDPDVAYDAGTGRFFVVWEKVASATSSDIVGQRYNASGMPVGLLDFVNNSGDRSSDPAVANSGRDDQFVVTWTRETSDIFNSYSAVMARTIAASTSVLPSPEVVLDQVVAPAVLLAPDIGGNQTEEAPGEAYAVWESQGSSGEEIRGKYLSIGASQIGFAPGFDVHSNSTATVTPSQPSISSDGGANRVYALGYKRVTESAIFGDSTTVFAQGLDAFGNELGLPVFVDASPSIPDNLDVEGNGSEFIAAWDRPIGSFQQSSVVAARPLTLGPNSLVVNGPEQLVAGNTVVKAIRPRVAYGAGKSWIQYAQDAFGSVSLKAAGVDSSSCAQCESPLTLSSSLDTTSDNALASIYRAGISTPAVPGPGVNTALDYYFSVWSEADGIGGTSIEGQLLESFGPTGSSVSLGGGCGSGGLATVIHTENIAAGNPNLVLHLIGAPATTSIAVLNINASVPPLSCGPCQITPFLLLFPKFMTGSSTSHTLAIPCKPSWVGAVLEAQWIVSSPGDAACVPDFSFSNRLALTFGI